MNGHSSHTAASHEQPLPLRHELQRKLLHLASAAVPVSYALGTARRSLLVALGAALLAAVGLEITRRRTPLIQRRFMATVGILLREPERNGWTGATWLLLAFTTLVGLAPRDVAIAGCWAVAAGDAMAAIVGRLVPRRPESTARKTFAGSTACFLVTVGGCVALAHLAFPESVIAGASATLAEYPTGGVNDNVRIALAVLAGIFLWRMVFS